MSKDLMKAFAAVADGGVTGRESALENSSRRLWLKNFAAVSATGAVLWACGKKEDSATSATDCTTLSAADKATNAGLLNAALGLENEAINIYTAAAGLPVWGTDANALAPTFLEIAKVFLAHHKAHAVKLSAEITELGGTPVTANDAATDLAHYPGIASLTGASGLLVVLKAAAERELGAAKAYYSLIGSGMKGTTDIDLIASIAPDEAAHYGVLAAAAFVAGGASSGLDQNTIVPSAFAGTFAVPSGFSPRT